MKQIAALILTAALLWGLLTACGPRKAEEPTAPATTPPETIVETIPFESLPDAEISPEIYPEIMPSIPLETFPEKPEGDYSIPPGESPGSNAVDY